MSEKMMVIPKSEYEQLKAEYRIMYKGLCDIALHTMEITSQMNKDYDDYKKEFKL